MADTLVISLDPDVLARLRRLADVTGEPIEDLARAVLEDAAADVDDAMGDDEELRRRAAAWKEQRLGASADDVRAWLGELETDPDAKPPTPKRMP